LLPPIHDADPELPTPITRGADLELAILRQLTHMLGEDMDLNKIVMAVLEGIYRVLDMDNVMFAVVNNRAQHLTAKFMLGHRRDEVMNRRLLPGKGDFIRFLEQADGAFWQSASGPVYNGTADPLIQFLAADEYFAHPVVLKGRLLGVVYADRGSRRTTFTAENLQTFVHICDHVSLAFKILARQA
jgi:GAF domain-containing protein